jgi:DNA-binding transcriptional regulator YiaG
MDTAAPFFAEVLQEETEIVNDILFIRQTLHMSKAELGRCFGYSKQAVSLWESGQTIPTRTAFRQIQRWAESLHSAD